MISVWVMYSLLSPASLVLLRVSHLIPVLSQPHIVFSLSVVRFINNNDNNIAHKKLVRSYKAASILTLIF